MGVGRASCNSLATFSARSVAGTVRSKLPRSPLTHHVGSAPLSLERPVLAAPVAGGRRARSPQAARALACRIHPPAAVKRPGVSPHPAPPAQAPTSRPASWVTRRVTGIFRATALSGSGTPSARGAPPPRAGSRSPTPADPPGGARGRLESVANSRRATRCGTAAGAAGAQVEAGGPFPPRARGPGAGVVVAGRGVRSGDPPRRPGRYSRNRLSRQSAVQPRGSPPPARSILPRRCGQTHRARAPLARPDPKLPPLRRGAGWAILAFPLPSPFTPGKAGPSPWPPLTCASL